MIASIVNLCLSTLCSVNRIIVDISQAKAYLTLFELGKVLKVVSEVFPSEQVIF